MKFVILTILFAGSSFAFPPSGPAYTSQLSAIGDWAKNLQNIAGVLNTINAQHSSSDITYVLTSDLIDSINANRALAANMSEVVDALSSGESLSGINNSIEGYVAAGIYKYNSLVSKSDGSAAPGSSSNIKDFVSSYQELAGAFSSLVGAINGLPGDSAVALGKAAQFYNLPNSINNVASARSNLAITLSAIVPNSPFGSSIASLVTAEKLLSSVESDLAEAFNNAAKK